MVESSSCPFYVGEHVDCLDTVNKWCNAEIKKLDPTNKRVFVHYTGFSAKYDEWMDYEPGDNKLKILKQWRRPDKFLMYQRLDILDKKGKWLEANIVDIKTDASGSQSSIKVHFKGFTPKWDEEIDLRTEYQ
jgi:hypothetical protein